MEYRVVTLSKLYLTISVIIMFEKDRTTITPNYRSELSVTDVLKNLILENLSF